MRGDHHVRFGEEDWTHKNYPVCVPWREAGFLAVSTSIRQECLAMTLGSGTSRQGVPKRVITRFRKSKFSVPGHRDGELLNIHSLQWDHIADEIVAVKRTTFWCFHEIQSTALTARLRRNTHCWALGRGVMVVGPPKAKARNSGERYHIYAVRILWNTHEFRISNQASSIGHEIRELHIARQLSSIPRCRILPSRVKSGRSLTRVLGGRRH